MMHSTSNVSTDATVPTSNVTSADDKVLADLATLEEQINLCRSMLSSSDLTAASDVDGNEALLAVVGFLEACAPRMVELIDGGMAGALGEAVLEKCLLLNDRLCRTLEDCDDPSKVTEETEKGEGGGGGETAAAPAAPSAAGKTNGLDDNNDDGDAAPVNPFTSGGTAAAAGSSGAAAATTAAGTADPFAGEPDLLTPEPAAPAPAAASASSTTATDDDFDLFLKERTSGGD